MLLIKVFTDHLLDFASFSKIEYSFAFVILNGNFFEVVMFKCCSC